MSGPLYWRNEVGGNLRLAIEAYLLGLPLAEQDIRLIRAYFRQWIFAEVWDQNPHMGGEDRARLDQLRWWVDGLKDRATIERWIVAAERQGLDPL